jgi:hypothetical protein
MDPGGRRVEEVMTGEALDRAAVADRELPGETMVFERGDDLQDGGRVAGDTRERPGLLAARVGAHRMILSVSTAHDKFPEPIDDETRSAETVAARQGSAGVRDG